MLLLAVVLWAGAALARADDHRPRRRAPQWRPVPAEATPRRVAGGLVAARRITGETSTSDSGRSLKWRRRSVETVRWSSAPVRRAEHRTALRHDTPDRPGTFPSDDSAVKLVADHAQREGQGSLRLVQNEEAFQLDDSTGSEPSVLEPPSSSSSDGTTAAETDAAEDNLGLPPLESEPAPEPFFDGLQQDQVPSRLQGGRHGQFTPERECAKGAASLKASRISTIDLGIVVSGDPGADFPFECNLEDTPFESRLWRETIYTWKASAVCHKPLYFDELALERYGHSLGPFVQPVYSAAHFFVTLPILPYKMGLKPPKECVYALGHYRPGSCAPYLVDPLPLSVRGGLLEAGAVVGVAAILP